ncbi:hypothetical protein SPFM1_00284 [Salmonella phage SPFM1]|nr:hypothetical protein SPFM1_00284 [Salmonella phage SPFM1]
MKRNTVAKAVSQTGKYNVTDTTTNIKTIWNSLQEFSNDLRKPRPQSQMPKRVPSMVRKFGYEAWYMVDIDVAITDMIVGIKPHLIYSHLNGGTVDLTRKVGKEPYFLFSSVPAAAE